MSVSPPDQPLPLQRERRFFADQQKAWQTQFPGKFVLVKDERLVNTFNKAEDAIAEGVETFGNEPFLVRPVDHSEDILFVPALAFGILHLPVPAT